MCFVIYYKCREIYFNLKKSDFKSMQSISIDPSAYVCLPWVISGFIPIEQGLTFVCVYTPVMFYYSARRLADKGTCSRRTVESTQQWSSKNGNKSFVIIREQYVVNICLMFEGNRRTRDY